MTLIPQKNPYLAGTVQGTPQNVPGVGGQVKSPYDNLNQTPNTIPPGQLKVATNAPVTQSTSGGNTTSGAINYQMTPQEASGGAAGLAAYNTRISSARGQSGSTPPPPPPPAVGTPPPPADTGGAPEGFYQFTKPDGTKMAVPNGSYVDSNGNITNPKDQGGAGTVNVGNQNQNQNTNYTAGNITLPQLLAQIANMAQSGGGNNPAIAKTQQEIQDLTTQYGNQTKNIQGGRTNLAEAGGEQGLLQNAYNTALGAKTTTLSQQTAQQQQMQTGLLGAAGLAQYQLGGYNQQVFNPLTGQFGSGQGGGGGGTSALSQLPAQAQSAIQSYAQQIQNGSITRADAESRLSAYGQPGLNALNEILGPNFNTNKSNASGQTTAIGQGIAAAIPPANQALDALQVAFNNLSSFQQGSIGVGNVPILAGIIQNLSMSSGLGRDAASKFQGALQEARSRIDAALTGVIGVDAARAQSSALLPDNMVPSELPGKIAAAKQYLQNQLESYTKSGQQTNAPANTNSTSLYSW